MKKIIFLISFLSLSSVFATQNDYVYGRTTDEYIVYGVSFEYCHGVKEGALKDADAKAEKVCEKTNYNNEIRYPSKKKTDFLELVVGGCWGGEASRAVVLVRFKCLEKKGDER